MKTPLRFALFLAAAATAFAGQKDKTLDIYWIDSEGGGSTLIVTPNDESVLIDTGNPGARDAGRIAEMAKAAGLTKIDYVALTHYHIDHFGGGAALSQLMPIGSIYQRAVPEGDPDGRPNASFFVNQIKPWNDIAAPRVALAAGGSIPLKPVTGGPGLQLNVIGADKKFIEPTAEQMKTKNPLTGTGTAKTVAPSDNDNSAIFVLSFGGFKFFDGGDLTWEYEEKLVTPYNLPGVVDVYQTNHHGLEVSNNPILIKSLAPTVVVMNNGIRKGGQPGSFAAIKQATSVEALYQIHKSANQGAENTPDEFIANLSLVQSEDQGHYIKLSVAPDAKTYTISIPATGHSKTFKTKVQ